MPELLHKNISMENAASILLRASQHPEKLRKALLYNESALPLRTTTGKISACVLSSGSSLVINAPECLSPWFL